MAYRTDLGEFKQWYRDFTKKYGGFQTSDKWVKRVEENHQKLRDMIGGVRLTRAIELKDVVPAVNFDDIDKPTLSLLSMIPKYFFDYKFNRKDLCVPTVQKGDNAGTKWGKHIQTWCKRNNVDKETIDKIAKITSALGEAWARSKTQKVTMHVTLTTDPKAFCLIGHYGVDNGSCFRQHGCNQTHKYMIGQTLNTYVLLVSSEPDGFEQAHDDLNAKFPLLARYWGVANDELDIFGLVNWYQKKNEPEGNVYNATEQFFAELLGVEKIKRHNDQIKVPPVYQNKVVNWCVCKPSKPFSPQTFIMAQGQLNDFVPCELCKETFTNGSEGSPVDGKYVCNECKSQLQTCQHSRKLTFKKLVKALSHDGKEIMVSSQFVDERIYIEFDGLFYHNKLLIKLENNHFIKKEEGKDTYVKCKTFGCSYYINTKESRIICRKCEAASKEMNKSDYLDYSNYTVRDEYGSIRKVKSYSW